MRFTVVASYCVFLMIFSTYESLYDSITSSVELPDICSGSAAGYDDENDIILIFGGYYTQQQLQFQHDAFIYYNESYLDWSQSVHGYGQNYFQLNDTLWMLHGEGTHLITASMHPPYRINIPNINIPFTVHMSGCLAMTTRHIFIVGGSAPPGNCDTIHAHVQIYDMIDGQWLDAVPSLPTNRSHVACYATDDTLYAIGGFAGNSNCDIRYDSILVLNVSAAALADISSQEWRTTSATLNTPSSSLCIVKHRNNLILVGGRYADNALSNEVHILNTLTGDCYLSGTLSTATSSATCILPRSNNTLYLFGGYSTTWNTETTKTWQFINLLTLNPTANPSAHPTSLPTQFPTSDPSVSPTANPSITPSIAPYATPTTLPTTALPHTASTPSDTTRNDTLYETSGRHTTEVRDIVGSTEFVLDRLAIILISICAILCFAVLIVLCTAAIYKNKEKECLKQAKNISDAHAPNDNVSAMDDDESSASLSLCEDGDKVKNKNQVLREIPELLKVTNNKATMHRVTKESYGVLDKKAKSNMLEVQLWLKYEVNLPQYLDVFVQNGYESMNIIKEIVKVTELTEIGITSEEHQKKLLDAIEKWKTDHVFEENIKREGSIWSEASGARSHKNALNTNTGEGDVVFDDVNKSANVKKIEYVFDNNNDAEVIEITEGEGNNVLL